MTHSKTYVGLHYPPPLQPRAHVSSRLQQFELHPPDIFVLLWPKEIRQKDYRIDGGERNADFPVNDAYRSQIKHKVKRKNNPEPYYATDEPETGSKNLIPQCMFGCLY
jgi:hypothetical protein